MSKRIEFNRFMVIAMIGLTQLGFSQCSFGIQPSLVEIKPEKDGTYTYVYKIKMDNSVIVKGGTRSPDPDFFTIYNFSGMVPGSQKQPAGWVFSTATNGLTPFRGGRTVLNPVDIAGIDNLTWSRSGRDLTTDDEISGFSIRSTVKTTMSGEYGSQVTRKTLVPNASPIEMKEARIGSVAIPKLIVRN